MTGRLDSAQSRDALQGAVVTTESALDNVNLFFRVLYDGYVGCLKQALRRHELHEIIKPGFGFVLFALFEDGVLRPSEITDRTGVRPTTLTAIVDQMVERKLVERLPDDSDRRAIGLRLLPAGEEVREACYQILEETTEIVGRGISEKEMETTKRVMRRMIENMAVGE